MTTSPEAIQARYSESEAVTFAVTCNHPNGIKACCPSDLTSYDQADRWLDAHEQNCGWAHTIYRQTAIAGNNSPALDALREIAGDSRGWARK
jgi:hypothetical protein